MQSNNKSRNFKEELRKIRDNKDRILVVGLGISGVASAEFLNRIGISCVCIEKESEENYRKKSKFVAQIDQLRKSGVDIHFSIDGEKVVSHLGGVALCVLSPGVPLESSICGALKRNSINMVSELELGIELLGWPSIVVTGSNGKSTTVSLIHAMCKQDRFDARLCGNVGIPVISEIPSNVLELNTIPEKSYLIVEASSYQLESCSVLKPKVGLFLNISENHLERHGAIDRYLRIKARLFENQDQTDVAILAADDRRVFALLSELEAQKAAFGFSDNVEKCSYYTLVKSANGHNDRIIFHSPLGEEIYDTSKTKLRGLHNRYNIAAAILAARLVGVDVAAINSVIANFDPLEHRIEDCGLTNEVHCFNDSKSTTVAASIAALESLLGEPGNSSISLMIGGLSKAGSWDPLCKLINQFQDRMHAVICFGGDGRLLANHCKANKIPHQVASNLEAGLRLALEQSKPGDLLLLSPGCASFDEFSDFEHRGRVFKDLLRNYKQNKLVSAG